MTFLSSYLRNTTLLQQLELNDCQLGNEGVQVLSECLVGNSSIIDIGIAWNKISNRGIYALVDVIYRNETMQEIDMDCNYEIGIEGKLMVLKALNHNNTVTWCFLNDVTFYFEERDEIQREVNNICGWNEVGCLSFNKVGNMDLNDSVLRRVVHILLILNEVNICNHLHWIILELLKVKDVVEIGDPCDEGSWK